MATEKSSLIAALNNALVSTYNLMAFTHQAHWNVEGEQFYQLHAEFGKQYEALLGAADEIAERIQELGAYAQLKGLKLDTIEDTLGAAREVLGVNIDCQDAIIDAMLEATKANDLVTQNLMIERATWHEKVIWQLKAFTCDDD